MKRQVAVTLATAGASVALLGGAALAAMAPEATTVAALTDPAGSAARTERGKPPVAQLEEILAKLVAEGKITAAQRDAILARLADVAGKAKERAPAFGAKHALAGAMKAAAAYLGMTERELGAALREGKSIAEVAVGKGRTRDGVIAAVVADATKRIDDAAAAGRLTAEQAAAAKAELAAAAAKLVDAKHERRAGEDKSKERMPKGAVPNAHAFIGGYLRDARAFLGLTSDELQARLRAGKSLAEIATETGRTREGLIAAIVAPANTKIDGLASSGRITAEAAAKAKAQAATAVGKIVDAKRTVKRSDTERGKRR